MQTSTWMVSIFGLLALTAGACGGGPTEAEPDEGPCGESSPPCPTPPARSDTQQCAPSPLDPNALPEVSPTEAFESLGIDGIVSLLEAPDTSQRFFVAQQVGVVHLAERQRSVWSTRPLLDISPRMRCCGDYGLLALAVSPRFAFDRLVFTLATMRGAGTSLVLTRWRVHEEMQWIELASETTLLEIPLAEGDLQGADLRFDNDGHLLLITGAAAGADERLGKILRMDVSALDETGELGVPEGNPDPESFVFAAGLSAPRGCSVDAESGALWCVDGDRIHLIGAGADLDTAVPLDTIQTEGCGLTGGQVYRGFAAPELWGAYIFSQGCEGQVWGLRPQPDGQIVKRHLGDFGVAIERFTKDDQGNVFALGEGERFKVSLAKPNTALGWSQTLSETGCFESLSPLVPTAELVPYTVSSPLWTDGAIKTRYLVLPPGEAVHVGSEGAWELPLGSVIVKNFAYDTPERGRQIVETRFMVKQPFGWDFHTYKWNDEGTEATLLDGLGSLEAPIEALIGGEPTTVDYQYPSRIGCQACHFRNAVSVIGVSAAQLNVPVDYQGGAENQLDAMSRAGFFDTALSSAQAPAPLPDPADSTLPLDVRARSYLDANCAFCHQPGGWTPPNLGMDLRFDVDLEQTGACGVPRKYTSFEVPGDYRIAPGVPADSNLYQRMIHRGLGQMPPLGTTVKDPLIPEVIGAWITSMEGCAELRP